jgi:hypothetical protein
MMQDSAALGRVSLGPNDSVLAQRRVAVIWGLLMFNCLAWIGPPTVLPLNPRLAQVFTMGALGLALLLALTLNRSLVFRPNLFLTLFTALAVLSLMTSVRGTAGLGGILRCLRLLVFLLVLWLLTPWWGRRDLLLARCHLRALLVVCATVLLGIVVAPSHAFAVQGRLGGAVWPIWPTAVAHFAAMATGMAVASWFSGSMSGKKAGLLGGTGTAVVLLTQTRVAMLGLVVGLAASALTLFPGRRRVRRAAILAVAVMPVAVVALTPALSAWFTRGQTAEQISGLTGRRQVWEMVVSAPRPAFNHWFGFGLSDKGFAGRSIDNSWLAIYQDQGLVGVAIVACIVLLLLVAAAFRTVGPAKALAVFIVVYAVVDSYTEVGLGDASSYLLDLAVAASLLIPYGSTDSVGSGDLVG